MKKCLELQASKQFVYLTNNFWEGPISIEPYIGITEEEGFFEFKMTEANDVDALANAVGEVYLNHQKKSDEILKTKLENLKEENIKQEIQRLEQTAVLLKTEAIKAIEQADALRIKLGLKRPASDECKSKY